MDNFYSTITPILTREQEAALESQNSRLVPNFKASQLELLAKKHWDLFYKRNETRFFRDRHWTTREFTDLLDDKSVTKLTERRILFEIGCGVGNLIFPLMQDPETNFFFYACDLSSKAVELVRNSKLYNSSQIDAFQADITTDEIFNKMSECSVDVVTFVFVLSAIHPEKFVTVLRHVYKLLKPGGCLLFRDYGLYDMAQLRFKAGHKIAENFYVRQDGTRSYYFSTQYLNAIMRQAGFERNVDSVYVHRRTINKKENLDVPRIFVQGKFIK